MIPNIRTNHCPHCKAQAGIIDAQAEVMAVLRARMEVLEKEIDRLRGPATTYKKGYGVGDWDAALQETER